MTGPARLDRDAIGDAIRDMIRRECDRVDDPGASIPGADPHDAHGWHANTGRRHPREPGMPLYQPDAWRFFRLLDVGWLGDDPLIGFAWDELGTPNLHYLTRTRFMASDLHRHPLTLALNVRMHLRYLLAPTAERRARQRAGGSAARGCGLARTRSWSAPRSRSTSNASTRAGNCPGPR